MPTVRRWRSNRAPKPAEARRYKRKKEPGPGTTKRTKAVRLKAGRLLLLQFGDGFEEDMADDAEAASADFVEGVLGSVPIARRVDQVDDVG